MQNNDDDNRPVLLIDAMNLFMRAHAAFPSMNADGEQMGGCIGFLKTMRKLVNEIQPSKVFIAWESGGSSKRRTLYAEYKQGRKAEKLNRYYESDIPESDENKQHQMVTLLAMLKCTPVKQLYVDNCEGDDVIAYLCSTHFAQANKVIASSDKDMYQLLDNVTKLYSFHKKRFVTSSDVLEEFRISSKNFALAKALCGDPSDNIPGVKGMGFKTAAKLFPFLGSDEHVLLQDVFDYCHVHIDESKIYAKVLDAKDDVKRNWRLVYLDSGTLSASQASKLDQVLGTPPPKGDRMGLIRLLSREGINNFDTEEFFYAFNCLDAVH